MEGFDVLQGLLGQAFTADISQDVAKFLLAWTIVKRTITTHLTTIENSLKSLATGVGELKTSMEKMEHAHSVRIGRLETEVVNLKGREDGKSV